MRYNLFLGSETSTSIDNLDVKLSSTFEDFDTLLRRDVVSNFGGIGAVVHQQQFKFLDIADSELQETVRHHVAGLLGGTVTNLGHRDLTLETTTDGTIDTLGLSPRFLIFM